MMKRVYRSPSSYIAIGATAGALVGAIITLVLVRSLQRRQKDNDNDNNNDQNSDDTCNTNDNRYLKYAKDRRSRLPSVIILVRHGESEGNADETLYRTKPDNLVELTERGKKQAEAAGVRIEEILQKYEIINHCCFKRLHLIVSPFERTLQTAASMRQYFEHRIVRTDVQPRIREQEFGNLQDEDFVQLRIEQKKVGRFWYRFPTGESGADVYDRVKSWWHDYVLTVNERYGYDHVDALVVVTHGLTMRFVLMQLYNWSPTTFHSVWNAGNCTTYVLVKDLHKPGMSPYVLDDINGDKILSSIDVMVEFKSNKGQYKTYKLSDYLSIPPPRTTRIDIVKKMLVEQYPNDINDEDDIEKIIFMPFIDGSIIQGRSSSGVFDKFTMKDGPMMLSSTLQHESPEMSCRFPNFNWRDINQTTD